MSFLKKRKFLFKLIVVLCLSLAIVSFCGNQVRASYLDGSASDSATGGDHYAPGGGSAAQGTNPEGSSTQGTNSEDRERSHAAQGGKLLEPIIDLLCTLGDGVMSIIHSAIMGMESAIAISIKTNIFIIIVSAILAIVAVGLVMSIFGPLATGLFAKAVTILLTVVSVPVGGIIFSVSYTAMSGAFLPDVTLLPTYSIGPEELFENKVLLFDVNIFNPRKLYVKMKDGNIREAKNSDGVSNVGDGEKDDVEYYFYYRNGEETPNDESNMVPTSTSSGAEDLKRVIAKWYYTIRNIAIIVSMLFLLYVGIRILTSSVAAEKAKYKQMFTDWLIGMCLIFLMQYIMVFSVNLVENITNLLSSATQDQKYGVQIQDAPDKLIEAVEDKYPQSVNGKNIVWVTNLMGQARVKAQQLDGGTEYIGYAMCFLVMVIYTVVFLITYGKRLLYIVFLTIIAPLVAMTYPIDKINDGKAQAFNMWLKEYIFNLLIQPFHLLLYIVLVSMAFDLAGSNIIYSLIAIGFLIPAEKFLRKMFGFDKASTPGFLGGATGAALTMSAMHSLERFAGRGPGANRKKELAGKPGDNKDGKIKFLDRSANSGRNMDDLSGKIAGNKKDENGKNEKDNNVQGNEQSKEDLQDGNDKQQEEKNKLSDQERQERAEELKKQMYDMEDEDYNFSSNPEYLKMRDELAGLEAPQEEQKPEDLQDEESDNKEEKTENKKDPYLDSKEDPSKHIGKYIKSRVLSKGRSIGKAYTKENMGKYFAKGASASVRGIAKGTLGLAGGAIGVAAGVASGDLGAVGKNATAGIYAGSAIGGGAANLVTNAGSNMVSRSKQRHEETLKEMYGSNYSSYQKRKKDEDFMKDKEMRELYRRELGLKKEEIDAAMRDAVKYREYGVTDNDIIIKAMSMDKGNAQNRADWDRIGAARMAMMSKSNKDLDSNIEKFAKKPGITDSDVATMRRRVQAINNKVIL